MFKTKINNKVKIFRKIFSRLKIERNFSIDRSFFEVFLRRITKRLGTGYRHICRYRYTTIHNTNKTITSVQTDLGIASCDQSKKITSILQQNILKA